MSDLRLNASLAFDRGIDSITYARQEKAMPLPERSAAPPPDTEVRAQLDLLLQKPSMDSRLDSLLRPHLENRALLSPGRFQEALGSTLQHLRQAAQQAPESSGEARSLNRAVRLLNEEASLRDLVQMYRSALYQG